MKQQRIFFGYKLDQTFGIIMHEHDVSSPFLIVASMGTTNIPSSIYNFFKNTHLKLIMECIQTNVMFLKHI